MKKRPATTFVTADFGDGHYEQHEVRPGDDLTVVIPVVFEGSMDEQEFHLEKRITVKVVVAP